ncbi:2,3-bisphosphoglycerate-independent phosphoglycerate mutase [Marinitoga litoralis]|nr:2,3-bisphosphoglycerate-independent phosphoglycerate mutase [Marinitoga litoralis]MBM7559217.1 2,3-bisphosphoglycerate-independent phosphoglycerate mutase [Marinitoga litoralis]
MMVDRQEFLQNLITKTDSKIVMLVMDGIGDTVVNGKTPLQAAKTPNLDKIATESDLGQTIPVLPGITPGSGPGHLGIFGYDPIKYQIGRGILEALGIDVEVGEKDVVARGNFATIDGDIVVDRRAGRPKTEESARVVEKLKENIKEIDGVKVQFYAGKEHRFVVKLTGEGLDDRIEDADPQKEGLPIKWAHATHPDAERAAEIFTKLMKQIKEVLKDEPKINFALIRGFSKYPNIPQFPEVYKMRAAAIAVYPMYKGLARLVGMDILDVDGETPADEFETLKKHWDEYDFFYIHIKKTDSYGEDGNFDAKVHVIEMVDEALPKLLELNPDVLVVTGDHSTPVAMSGHSWHPVPFMIKSPYTRAGLSKAFDEFEAARGSMGTIYAVDLMGLLLGNARKLDKFGA